MAWSEPVTVVEPATEPVSLDQAKEFLRLIGDEYDTELGGFITTAREHVENVTGTRLVEQTVELQADAWSDFELLPIGPATAIVSIKYDDSEGVEQDLDTAVFELCGAGLRRGIRTKVGQAWPSGLRSASGVIRVQLQVGYATLPKTIWATILRVIADLFTFRETATIGAGSSTVSSSTKVDDLLANHRIWL